MSRIMQKGFKFSKANLLFAICLTKWLMHRNASKNNKLAIGILGVYIDSNDGPSTRYHISDLESVRLLQACRLQHLHIISLPSITFHSNEKDSWLDFLSFKIQLSAENRVSRLAKINQFYIMTLIDCHSFKFNLPTTHAWNSVLCSKFGWIQY